MSTALLYGTRLSPFVEKVARGLALKNLEFELIVPQRVGDLRRWNPQAAKMPVLEIDGERTHDSTFILRRLDELIPQPRLLSDDARTAAAQRLLEDWADESLYWLRMAILWSQPGEAANAVLDGMPIPTLLKPVLRVGITRQFLSTIRAQGYGRLPREVLLREFALRLDDLTEILGDSPFFFGDQPSVADLAVFGMLHFNETSAPEAFDEALASRGSLSAWKKRLGERAVA